MNNENFSERYFIRPSFDNHKKVKYANKIFENFPCVGKRLVIIKNQAHRSTFIYNV